jgi:hypothetical protein
MPSEKKERLVCKLYIAMIMLLNNQKTLVALNLACISQDSEEANLSWTLWVQQKLSSSCGSTGLAGSTFSWRWQHSK